MSVPVTNAQFAAKQAAEIQQLLAESRAVREANTVSPNASSTSPEVQKVLEQMHQAQTPGPIILVANNDLETAYAVCRKTLEPITDSDVQSVAMAGQRSDSDNPLMGMADSLISNMLFPGGVNPLAMLMGGGIGNVMHMSQMNIGEGDKRMQAAVEALGKLREAVAARLKDTNFVAQVTGPQAGQLQVPSVMDAALAKVLQSLLAKLGGRTDDLHKLIAGPDNNLKSQLIDTAIATTFEADATSKAKFEAVLAYSQANRSYAATTKGAEGALAGIFEKLMSTILPKVMQHEQVKASAVDQLTENLDNAAMPEILESVAKLLLEAAAKVRAEQQPTKVAPAN